MEINDFILKFLERLKMALTNTVSDLEPDELKWQAGPQANPIGFILWHQIRAEDRFINAMLQQKPQVWEQEKWYQKMNLSGDPNDTGSGYTAEQVAAFAVPELEVFRSVERAELALVEGKQRIALDLSRPALARPDQDATSGRALSAAASVPKIFARQSLLRRHHV